MLRRASLVLGSIALCALGVLVMGVAGVHTGLTLDDPQMALLFAVLTVNGLLLGGIGVRVFSANVPLHWERGSTTVPVLRRGRN